MNIRSKHRAKPFSLSLGTVNLGLYIQHLNIYIKISNIYLNPDIFFKITNKTLRI